MRLFKSDLCFRFGHTLVKDKLTSLNFHKFGDNIEMVSKEHDLEKIFFHDTFTRNAKKTWIWWGPLLKGMCYEAAGKADRYFNKVLSHQLFKSQEEFLVKGMKSC